MVLLKGLSFLAAGCLAFLTPTKNSLTKSVLLFSGPVHVHLDDKEATAEAHHQGQLNCTVLS